MNLFIHTFSGRFGAMGIALMLAFQMVFGLTLAAYAEEPPEEPAEEVVEEVTEEAEEPSEEAEEETVAEEAEESEEESTTEETEQATSASEEESSTEPAETEIETEGADGTDGEDLGDGPAVVVTGDAAAIGDTQNQVNTNIDTESTASTTDTGAAGEVAGATTGTSTSTTTESTGGGGSGTSTPSIPSIFLPTDEVNASSTNDATIENNATTTAETGENIATGETAIIDTGDAIAVANVVNLANTNILNSDGFIEFFASLGFNTIDLRDAFTVFDDSASAVSTTPCSPSVCDTATEYTTETTNDATITNNVGVISRTGGNNATGGEGGASVATGDAYATANVVNIANTNIVDSNYLLLSFNNLGDMDGDIVLPNSDVFKGLFSGGSGTSGADVTNTNTANVNNEVAVGADTGGNTAEGGAVDTGDATATANVVNQVNQNLIGADSFLLLLRVHGDWSGDIFGLPEGMTWSQTPDGIKVFMEPTGSGAGQSAQTVQNTNNATINNNVSVFALTGDNEVKAGGDSSVTTGDAHASASIVNLVNNNILGQNWALLIFDIFGNWNGNLAFGRPDLWIGAEARPSSDPLFGGDRVDYTFTVMNTGDTVATDVVIDGFFDQGHLRFSGGDTGSGAPVSWSVGTLRPGETRKVRAEAQVHEAMPRSYKSSIPLEVTVSARENEDDIEDNTDLVTIETGENSRKSSRNRNRNSASGSGSAGIEMTKTVSVSTTTVPASIDYTITIHNDGDYLYNAMLADTLTDSGGMLIDEQHWELGTILPDEKITVMYTTEFSSSTVPGVYTNVAQIFGTDRSDQLEESDLYVSETASADITVLGGQVLGASCSIHLDTFMRLGIANDAGEVRILQSFLNEHMGAGLVVSGVFDDATDRAVKNFQRQYEDEVLIPWGMTAPSGYVYLTTRKKINELLCDGAQEFPLTQAQLEEIAQYRLRLPYQGSRGQLIGERDQESTLGSREASQLEFLSQFVLRLYPVAPNVLGQLGL